MKTRITAAALWFLAASYAWGLIAFVTGAPASAAAAVGLVAGTLVGVDPAGLLWRAQGEPKTHP